MTQFLVAGVGWGGESQHTNQQKTKHCSHLYQRIRWRPASKRKACRGRVGILNKRQTGGQGAGMR
jgi:hypothetical protein